MANLSETYVLVRNESMPLRTNKITDVVRTYESKDRAEEDIDLLTCADSTGIYSILTIPHIDR